MGFQKPFSECYLEWWLPSTEYCRNGYRNDIQPPRKPFHPLVESFSGPTKTIHGSFSPLERGTIARNHPYSWELWRNGYLGNSAPTINFYKNFQFFPISLLISTPNLGVDGILINVSLICIQFTAIKMKWCRYYDFL